MDKLFSKASQISFTVSQKIDVDADGWILFLPHPAKKNPKWDEGVTFLDAATRKWIDEFARRFDFKPKAGEALSFDKDARLRVVLATLPKRPEAFFFLELARKAVESLSDAKSRHIFADIRGCGENAPVVADAVASALVALLHEAKQYGEEDKDEKKIPKLSFLAQGGVVLDVAELRSAAEVTEATNLVRYLSAMAGNDLTPGVYVETATRLAKAQGLKTSFYSLDKLEKLKAGAFLAVTRGSEEKDAGILKVSYTPSKAKSKVALVGKGITFDTGGSQLKTGEHMFGMNGDMGGSAVALALVLLASKQKWPWQVDAYLAIAENAIGPRSYRPNDIVRTMSGKTIEVVDADAEGRMVLADTLWLAGKESPDLMIDFATLTGACLRAIGTNYSGAYTNRPEWWQLILDAGKESGERVWPFPSDSDYGRCLKSDIADIKQCRLTGGSDHIEAGYFLSRFVPKTIPWLHVDLSAAENEEGLAHVPDKLTGFGVRFGARFIRKAAKI